MKRLCLIIGLALAYATAMPFLIDAQIPNQPDQKQIKHTVAPPIHSAKGVIASAWSKDHVKHRRGLNKTPRYKLVSARRFDKTGIAIPSQITMLPKQLSMWGNDQYGDCVSASEAARIAAYSVFCGLPETFIPEATLIAWAQKGGYLNGADLTDVMTDRKTRGMADATGKLYVAGPYASVDYTDENALKAALTIGPVNVGMDADALPSGAGNVNGWFVFGGSPGQFSNEDHCIAIFGYGATKDLAAAISQAYGVTVTLPASAPASGYIFYTWSTVGIVDHAWIMSTVGETWSQNPTTVGQSPSPTPVPPTPTPSPTPNPAPAPGTATISGGTITFSDGSTQEFSALPAAALNMTLGQLIAGQAGKQAKSAPKGNPRMDALEKRLSDQDKINGKILDRLDALQKLMIGDQKK
jgi:hypothetical protein